MPIPAVGAGDVALTVQVLAADGTTVGTPTTSTGKPRSRTIRRTTRSCW